MSEFKGTKGKWRTYNSDDDSITIVKEDESQAIAFLPELFIESEANAKLIACAPEMLDLLSSIENDEKQVPKFLWDKIQQLIKKATE